MAIVPTKMISLFYPILRQIFAFLLCKNYNVGILIVKIFLFNRFLAIFAF